MPELYVSIMIINVEIRVTLIFAFFLFWKTKRIHSQMIRKVKIIKIFAKVFKNIISKDKFIS